MLTSLKEANMEDRNIVDMLNKWYSLNLFLKICEKRLENYASPNIDLNFFIDKFNQIQREKFNRLYDVRVIDKALKAMKPEEKELLINYYCRGINAKDLLSYSERQTFRKLEKAKRNFWRLFDGKKERVC